MNKRLTRKELVEHIKQVLPDDYDEFERIAFIEKEVANQIAFDEKYLWGDIEAREKIYKLAKRNAQKPQPEVSKKLICVTMAELFGYVAKQFGYDVKYQKRAPVYVIKTGDNEIFESISEENQDHVCPVVGLSNGRYIEVDIQEDLMRLQTGVKPKAFGGDKHGDRASNGVLIQRLDADIVERTFRKVYGMKPDEKFTDEYINSLATKLKSEGKSPMEILDFFMCDPEIKNKLQNTKCIEANKLYRSILKACYGKADGKEFFDGDNRAIIEECILSDNEGRKRFSFCVFAEENQKDAFYIYSKRSKKMIKMTREEIQQMTQKVMNVQVQGRESELKDNMMLFVTGNKANAENQESKGISLEEIFMDEEEL